MSLRLLPRQPCAGASCARHRPRPPNRAPSPSPARPAAHHGHGTACAPAPPASWPSGPRCRSCRRCSSAIGALQCSRSVPSPSHGAETPVERDSDRPQRQVIGRPCGAASPRTRRTPPGQVREGDDELAALARPGMGGLQGDMGEGRCRRRQPRPARRCAARCAPARRSRGTATSRCARARSTCPGGGRSPRRTRERPGAGPRPGGAGRSRARLAGVPGARPGRATRTPSGSAFPRWSRRRWVAGHSPGARRSAGRPTSCSEFADQAGSRIGCVRRLP